MDIFNRNNPGPNIIAKVTPTVLSIKAKEDTIKYYEHLNQVKKIIRNKIIRSQGIDDQILDQESISSDDISKLKLNKTTLIQELSILKTLPVGILLDIQKEVYNKLISDIPDSTGGKKSKKYKSKKYKSRKYR